jgi:bifunctional UDP-N-acetylglucosamine pyrophosphorylase / glucosamine-1-phosphate N-acetyltransferase
LLPKKLAVGKQRLDRDMTHNKQNIKEILMRKGVTLMNPESIDIGNELDPERVAANGVIIYSGSKIYGERTLILSGSVIGHEAPATIENCFIGPNVKLGGGYFSDSVFLKNVTFGSCAHVREGCILEENSGAAHSVGLKQTILFPYVTLGSLINFCDCLMSGGTGKKNHSEVGSSYIHFNFTPQQDKATPSLIGDAPHGVMLDQPPIFLGGQGGLVGPCRLGFGITIAAGTICRTDELRPHRLIFGGSGREGNISYTPGVYRNIKRIFTNNLTYIGNVFALRQWYASARSLFISEDFPQHLLDGLSYVVNLGINERIKRLKEFICKLDDSIHLQAEIQRNLSASDRIRYNQELVKRWPEIEGTIRRLCDYDGDEGSKSFFLAVLEKEIQKTGISYIDVIKGLDPDVKKIGSQWLQGIVDRLVNDSTATLPSSGSDSMIRKDNDL